METKCTKESFVSKEFADQALELYNKKYDRNLGKKLTNSYLCPKCGTWHLTSNGSYQSRLKRVEQELLETKQLLAKREDELFKRMDEMKVLRNKGTSKSQIDVRKLSIRFEKLKRRSDGFRKRFEEKANQYNHFKNMVLKYNKSGRIDLIIELIQKEFLTNK